MTKICKACREGQHRRCVDAVNPSPPILCECANGVHENHYDADDQLILVQD